MEKKRDFKSIIKDIKEACLSLGYGDIYFDKDAEDLWINNNENSLGVRIHVDAILINYDIITLCENNQDIITFDQIYSIDKLISIYETIYKHREQLSFYELDWAQVFHAKRVSNDDGGHFLWRILTPEEARHIWYNGNNIGDLCHLYDDGTESLIEDNETLEDCITQGYDIGIEAY